MSDPRPPPVGGREREWRPRVNPWLIAFAVMLATFLEVLDTSSPTSRCRRWPATSRSRSDEATWVLTSYLVSNAIVLPMTGWLSTGSAASGS